MRALRSCDFCSEQAVGTFEVVPEELEPTEVERRRVVLCESCRETLETLIEPLLDRAGTNNSAASADNPSGSAGSETDAEPDGPGSSSGPDLDTDGSPSNSDSDESDESSGAGSKEESPDTDSFSKLDSDSGTADESTDGDTSADSSPPNNYGKVLRLLRNREFPMARDDVVAIASNAYGLNTTDVEEIIDEAIDRDEFVEQKGKLHRT